MDPSRWADPGSEAPERLQKLLRAAPTTRPMTAAARARSAAWIHRLAAQPPPRSASSLSRAFTWGSALAVALGGAALWLVSAKGSDPALNAHVLQPEPPHGAAARAGQSSGLPADSAAPYESAATIALSLADACGRHVCSTSPWCCTERWDSSCDAQLMDEAVILADYQAMIGSCYYHDRRICPGCACPYYVKVAGNGYDGGTGCLNELGDVFEVLKTLCATGRCER